MRKLRHKSIDAARHRTRRLRVLRVERLEERLTLDAQGALVAFDPHFTLSFADDGVSAAGQMNSLAATFNAISPEEVWHENILRAFQTWASQTNADIGIVADGGQAFGSPGVTLRDKRFGDIRVGAIAISPEVGAVSVPVDNFVSGTWLADVLFNSQFDYHSADEILAVAMHEAGNVFGLEDGADPTSPLFTGGPPTVKTPTAADVAVLQTLYGARLPDANEATGGNQVNDSFSTATKLELWETAVGDVGTAPTIVYGDIGSSSDIDYFYLDTPGEYFGPVTFTLRSSGISLLQPDFTICDASQQPIDHLASQDVGGDVLTVKIPSSTPHQRLYLRVAGAAPDVFGIGGYSLIAQFDGINLADQATIDSVANGQYRFLTPDELAKFFDGNENELFNDDGHSDDEANLGTELDSLPAFVADARYETTASIADALDVDYYVIKSPQVTGMPLSVMTVAVRSLDVAGLIPELRIFDEDLNPLASEIVVNGGGELVVQVSGVEPHSDYIIGVEAADPGGPFESGNYRLGIGFSNTAVTFESLASGTVGDDVTGNVHTLYIGRPQLFHLVLEAETSATTVPSAVVATIKDENSAVVATIAAPPGERRSLPGVFLNAGTYTVEVEVRTLDRSVSAGVNYSLLGTAISDPFVGDPEDPNSHPFACMDPELAGYFCYPGDIISPDPFLWDSFVASRSDPPPPLDLGPLVDLLLGDWWSWVWNDLGSNGPPLAQDDYFEMQVGPGGGSAAATIPLGPTSNVLDNDFEPEGDPFVAVLVSAPTHGSLDFHADGTFAYTPDAGFRGTDRFGYVASDFRQESAAVTVRIVVSTGVVGDYNGDGVATAADYLSWKADFGSVDELLSDGNRNGRVDAADYTVWRNNLSAAVVATPGDYNGDTVVDDADYSLWKSGFGSVDDLRADGNHDGRVNSADYTIWRDNLSARGGGAAMSAAMLPGPLGRTESSPLNGEASNSRSSSLPGASRTNALIVFASSTATQPENRIALGSAVRFQNSTTIHRIAESPSLLLAAMNRMPQADHLPCEATDAANRTRVTDVAFSQWPHQLGMLRFPDAEFIAGAKRWRQ